VSSLSSRYKHFLSKLKSSYDSVLPPPEEIWGWVFVHMHVCYTCIIFHGTFMSLLV
jgi:hypothetical protein